MDNQRIQDFESISLKLASPEDILNWSHGEITKPETINYRSQKPEKDGLFDERIFGPTKDYECYCGKYRRIRYKGIVCDKCGVEVTRAVVRRERMGHIKLASPVSHIWFLRGVPSKIGMVLNMSVNNLENVIYFRGYIVTKVDEEKRKEVFEQIEKEFKSKTKNSKGAELTSLKQAKEKAFEEVRSLRPLQVISEVEYHRLSLKYGEMFEADIGAEAIRKILEGVDLAKIAREVEAEAETAESIQRAKIFRRLKVVKGMIKAGIRPEWMFLTVIPVIPPDLRPMVPLDGGRYATADLNDLYRRVINRNNRLKRLFELKAPEVITRNEKRMLQEAIDALIDNTARRGQSPVASQAQKRPLKSLADMLKGKQGRFRQNLLGKRVDYSGRSVIVVGPNLKLAECGLPKEMALELFKPFVIRKLIEREITHNIKGAGRLIEERPPEVWAILEEVIEGKYVLLNRAPTLHRLGIQAFQPVLIEGYAIQIHPMVCPAFNADFDGDQMAVHLPLTDEAQTESRDIMLSAKNLLKPATGTPIARPTQDIVLGCYWVTVVEEGVKGEGKVFASAEDAILAYDFGEVDIRAKIKVRLTQQPTTNNQQPTAETQKIKSKSVLEVGSGPEARGLGPLGKSAVGLTETSVGRLLFNKALPDDYPYINKDMNAKDLEELVDNMIKKYGVQIVPSILDKIKEFGFTYATKSGISWGMSDLETPGNKKELVDKCGKKVEEINEQYQRGLLTDKERYDRVIEIWSDVMVEIRGLIPQTLVKYGPISSIVTSKARGSLLQINQMCGMKGLVVNPAGRIMELPILSSYKDGFNVLEYFISTHGARKGTADTALKTAVAGYLTRRLVDVSQDVVVTENDCGTKSGITIYRKDSNEIGRQFGSRIFSRYALEDIKDGEGRIVVKAGEVMVKELSDAVEISGAEDAVVRSPLNCKSISGICQMCYGLDLGKLESVKIGEAVGIVAAQSIGEPGTQLTMRTFHTGGVAGGGDITTGLPRVEEIFEVRTPKGKAVISDVDGEIIEILNVNREKIIKVKVEENLSETEDGDAKRKRGRKSKKKLLTDTKEFRIPPGTGLFTEAGKRVRVGEILCEGHADLKELFKLAGKEDVERYIIKEVQKIYSLQGAPVHDKHIEVIVRQMFSRVRVKEVGDSSFTPGEVIEKIRFRIENRQLERAGKKPATATQILLGITKVALTTDSFFSSASFQETARVLINAAIEGKEDMLRGLKENVIIGRLIPAGTGYKKR